MRDPIAAAGAKHVQTPTKGDEPFEGLAFEALERETLVPAQQDEPVGVECVAATPGSCAGP
ncbi:MAG: hypothetical protein ACYC1D_12345 [Acidimicrobiales bacterium]